MTKITLICSIVFSLILAGTYPYTVTTNEGGHVETVTFEWDTGQKVIEDLWKYQKLVLITNEYKKLDIQATNIFTNYSQIIITNNIECRKEKAKMFGAGTGTGIIIAIIIRLLYSLRN